MVLLPDIEPDQAQVQVLARGDLSAKERDQLVKEAEDTILPQPGVRAFYVQSFKSGKDGESSPARCGWHDPNSI